MIGGFISASELDRIRTASDIRDLLQILHPEGDSFEIRLAYADAPAGCSHVQRFFGGPDHAVACIAEELSFGIYNHISVSLDPCWPLVDSRGSYQQWAVHPEETCVARQANLLLDFQPTLMQRLYSKDCCLTKRSQVQAILEDCFNFPEGVCFQNDGGAKLLYKIEESAMDGGLVRRFYQKINYAFCLDTVEMKVDPHNTKAHLSLPVHALWFDSGSRRSAFEVNKPDSNRGQRVTAEQMRAVIRQAFDDAW